MNLAALQRQFAKALLYQSSGETCSIVGDQFNADERLQVYRNNFIISLSEVLSATYPMVEVLIGEECFAQIARKHVLKHPLTEAHVAHYGEGFQDTIKTFDQVMAKAPYIIEVACFEWALDLARQDQREKLPNTKLIPLAQLADVPANQQPKLVFHLKSECRSFDSHYAVFDLFKAIQAQEFGQLNINQPQCGVILSDLHGIASCYALDMDTFQLLRYFEQEQPLENISSSLLTNLGQIMQLDLFAGFTLENN